MFKPTLQTTMEDLSSWIHDPKIPEKGQRILNILEDVSIAFDLKQREFFDMLEQKINGVQLYYSKEHEQYMNDKFKNTTDAIFAKMQNMRKNLTQETKTIIDQHVKQMTDMIFIDMNKINDQINKLS